MVGDRPPEDVAFYRVRKRVSERGIHHTQTEVPVASVLAAAESPTARNELHLRVKRATDTMLFKPMPDHRLADVKPVPPPGGLSTFRSSRGRGGR